MGDTEGRGDEPNEMGANLPAIDLGTGKAAKAIATGSAHACALLEDGSVKCWGFNYNGQLGLGDTEDRGDEPNEMGDIWATRRIVATHRGKWAMACRP